MLVSRKRRLSSATASGASSVARTLLRRTLVLLVLSEYRAPLSESWQPRSADTTLGRNKRGISQRISLFSAAEGTFEVKDGTVEGTVEYRQHFVDDGMFDPRRDYWGNYSTTVGSQSAGTTPTSFNWATAAHRGLASTSSACGPASSSEPCCIECFGLSYCDVLNGYKVEDKYFPGEPTILGSCENFEDRASRLEVFGPSKTFRDTAACREMVIDYTCLWWGSDNEMYDNRCGRDAQVYPCRSYCVQLAKTCANNVVEWQELCRAIGCPPTDEECMPGPFASQKQSEGCYLYEYHSPLSAATRAGFSLRVSAAVTVLAVAAAAALGATAA